MKRLLSLAAVAVIGTLLALVLIPGNKIAPAFSLTNLQGKSALDADLRGRVSFISFWFPSCPGYVNEIPKIIKMAKDCRGKDSQVLGIIQPIGPPESVNQYAREYGLPSTVMFDGSKAATQTFGTQIYPTSFLTNKKGEILRAFIGEPDFVTLYQGIGKKLAE